MFFHQNWVYHVRRLLRIAIPAPAAVAVVQDSCFLCEITRAFRNLKTPLVLVVSTPTIYSMCFGVKMCLLSVWPENLTLPPSPQNSKFCAVKCFFL